MHNIFVNPALKEKEQIEDSSEISNYLRDFVLDILSGFKIELQRKFNSFRTIKMQKSMISWDVRAGICVWNDFVKDMKSGVVTYKIEARISSLVKLTLANKNMSSVIPSFALNLIDLIVIGNGLAYYLSIFPHNLSVELLENSIVLRSTIPCEDVFYEDDQLVKFGVVVNSNRIFLIFSLLKELENFANSDYGFRLDQVASYGQVFCANSLTTTVNKYTWFLRGIVSLKDCFSVLWLLTDRKKPEVQPTDSYFLMCLSMGFLFKTAKLKGIVRLCKIFEALSFVIGIRKASLTYGLFVNFQIGMIRLVFYLSPNDPSAAVFVLASKDVTKDITRKLHWFSRSFEQ